VYFARLWAIVTAAPRDPEARRFVIGVVVAFLPAVVIGVLFRDFIKGVLFNPLVVCATLILGGFVLIVIDTLRLEVRETDATRFPLRCT
jgi:undecaprenyl-diphosphatase